MVTARFDKLLQLFLAGADKNINWDDDEETNERESEQKFHKSDRKFNSWQFYRPFPCVDL